MNAFQATVVSAESWREAAGECARALTRGGPRGDLGFVYATVALESHLQEITSHLRQHTGIEHWVGTVGEGLCSNGREHYDAPALVAMATDLSAEQFRILPAMRSEVTDVLAQTEQWRGRSGSYFGILHGDPRNPDTPRLVAALAEGTKGGFFIGGLTTSVGDYPQIADEGVYGGISGVLLSGDVRVATGLTQGCSLLGERHVVTESERNIVLTIDGKPAVDVLKEDIGELLARDLSRIAGYIFVALPVPGSDTGDYLVRNLVGIDPASKMIAIGDRVQTGESIQFARRDSQTARDGMMRMLGDLKSRVGDDPIRGALYYTCLGRGRYLFGTESEELRLIRDQFGDLPLVGFFANGEFSHNRLYGYTGVLTLFL